MHVIPTRLAAPPTHPLSTHYLRRDDFVPSVQRSPIAKPEREGIWRYTACSTAHGRSGCASLCVEAYITLAFSSVTFIQVRVLKTSQDEAVGRLPVSRCSLRSLHLRGLETFSIWRCPFTLSGTEHTCQRKPPHESNPSTTLTRIHLARYLASRWPKPHGTAFGCQAR